jgi:hypothetical protein
MSFRTFIFESPKGGDFWNLYILYIFFDDLSLQKNAY